MKILINFNGLMNNQKLKQRNKLKKITEKIGYPDFINNQTKLNERLVNY